MNYKIAELHSHPDAALVFDDTVLDKRFSRKIELVRRQYSGNEHRVIRGIGLISCIELIWDLLGDRVRSIAKIELSQARQVYWWGIQVIWQTKSGKSLSHFYLRRRKPDRQCGQKDNSSTAYFISSRMDVIGLICPKIYWVYKTGNGRLLTVRSLL